jgi:hypothetical protein
MGMVIRLLVVDILLVSVVLGIAGDSSLRRDAGSATV